jgi:hypothetical protein
VDKLSHEVDKLSGEIDESPHETFKFTVHIDESPGNINVSHFQFDIFNIEAI